MLADLLAVGQAERRRCLGNVGGAAFAQVSLWDSRRLLRKIAGQEQVGDVTFCVRVSNTYVFEVGRCVLPRC